MFVGVRVTVRALRRFRVLAPAVAVLATVAVVPGTAQAAHAARAKAAAATANSICGTPALAGPARAPLAAAADLNPFDIAKWLGEKAGGAIAGKAAGMAFDFISKLPGLKDILPESEGAKTLAELSKIEDQLTGVSARLDLIGGQVNQTITELRGLSLNEALDKACSDVDKAETLYQHYYTPTVQAAVTLGDILKSDHPANADVSIEKLPVDVQQLYTTSPTPCTDNRQITCFTPRTLVTERERLFSTAFETNQVLGTAGHLSNLLRPAKLTTSVLTAYGKFLMSRRYLNRTDSESLMSLYNDLSQGEALAAWMEAEYFTHTTVDEDATHVFKAYAADVQAERDNLPPMIPEGAVVDLEQTNASTSRNHPIWTLAGTRDQDFWPIGFDSNNNVTTTAHGAASALRALNSPPCVGEPACFTNWTIPSTIDLKALLSDNCKVDTTKNPPQLPPTCKPNVNTAVGSPNVAKYLVGLNPTDLTWTGVFCTGLSVTVSCAAPPDQHNFIWTTDRRSHWTDCGFEVPLYTVVYRRQYSLRVGLPLNLKDLNSVWPIYPIMPSRIPNYSLSSSGTAHTKCDDYTRTQIAAASNRGIVLATANTGMVGFMAQPAQAAVQDTTARDITQHAATDSVRYGRRHHGSFRGLSLRWLRHHRVPEARSGEPAYLIAAHSIDGGAGFTITARGEATEDTFTITDRPSGAVLHTCTRVDGGAGRHGCRHVKRGHGRW